MLSMDEPSSALDAPIGGAL